MTPEQEEQVRRALAATAEGEGPAPLPSAVGAQLDALLADLSRSRTLRAAPAARPGSTSDTGGSGDGARDDLAARRPRRWPQVLVAAATVAVLALAGGAVATGGYGLAGSSGDAMSSSDMEADAGGSAGQAEKSAPDPTGGDVDGAAPEALTSSAGPYRLRTATLPADLRRVARATAPPRSADDLAAPDSGADCARPSVEGDQTLVDVVLDGAASSLVLDDAPGSDGTRAARIYSCDDPIQPVRETTIR